MRSTAAPTIGKLVEDVPSRIFTYRAHDVENLGRNLDSIAQPRDDLLILALYQGRHVEGLWRQRLGLSACSGAKLKIDIVAKRREEDESRSEEDQGQKTGRKPFQTRALLLLRLVLPSSSLGVG